MIASTATIRKAGDQVHALFLRDGRASSRRTASTCGTTSSRSSGRRARSTPGRRYLGICAPGRRLKAALIRVYVALLSSAQVLYERVRQGRPTRG